MGSEGPSTVTVHITGFKKFHGVAENPTEIIVGNLKAFMEKREPVKGLVVGSCTILETAGQGALNSLHQVLESAVTGKEFGSSNSGQLVWLHFGVNSGASKFALENQAVNEATFRCPDELGWKPQRVPIIPDDGDITRTRQTLIPVKELNDALIKRGFNVAPSDDAGRFVCNYVYYHSLRFAEVNQIRSLFVHVPLFLTIDEDTQMEFAAALLEEIAALSGSATAAVASREPCENVQGVIY